MRIAEPLILAAEEAGARARRLAGVGVYGTAEKYFDPGEPLPLDPEYVETLDRINDDFVRWFEPGEVSAPDSGAVRKRGSLVTFPSPVRSGVDENDRVALRIYPAPVDAPAVGVIFHHWLFMGNWLTVDWLLGPLTRRYRVAVMVAPFHLGRRRPGTRSGAGMVNPNPRHVLEGMRQWQADHMASLGLLRRDFGFDRTVVVGYSLGGYCALLNRLLVPPRRTVAIAVTNNYARGVFEGVYTRSLRRSVREAGFTGESFQRATRSLDLCRWAGRIGGDKLTWIHPAADRIEPPDSLRAARNALQPERVVRINGGHATAVLNRARILREILRAVRREMGTRRPAARVVS